MLIRTCYIVLCALLLYTAIPAQQMPYSGRRHTLSRGGYNPMIKGYSHKGGLFRKSIAPKPAKSKKKVPVVFNS